MPCHSVLFKDPAAADAVWKEAPSAPDFFGDLNLDQAILHTIAPHEKYDLAPFFYAPLHSRDDIAYRHDVFRDMEDPSLVHGLERFGEAMRQMRAHAEQTAKLHYPLQRQRWFTETAQLYCRATLELFAMLESSVLRSQGLLGLRDYLAGYLGSPAFTSLHGTAQEVLNSLDAIIYTVQIEGETFIVRTYEDEQDYSQVIASVFEKFRQGEVKDYRVEFRDYPDMNHIEAQVLEFVAQINPAVFARLADFEARYKDSQDTTVVRFDREVQFYLAYHELIAKFEAIDRGFCYPDISTDKTVHCVDSFDLALGWSLLNSGKRVVCNDVSLEHGERMIVVTGPNQGGKTTFARMFGQLHYLAALGCPVPGLSAKLYLCDRIFTHFERQEDISTLSGKLQDDLIRIRRILDAATSSSIIIMNEIFTSTTLADALFLSHHVLEKSLELDLIGVWVTFIDEVASSDSDSRVVSMLSTVNPDQPTQRTFKVVRGPAEGMAYALSLAAKYGLTFDQITERIAS